MRNTARHDTALTSQPPSSGPSAAPTPVSPDHAPIARARSARRKLPSIIASEPGVKSAPPIPCRKRAATSAPALGAAAHSAEASVNQATPIVKMRRRP